MKHGFFLFICITWLFVWLSPSSASEPAICFNLVEQIEPSGPAFTPTISDVEVADFNGDGKPDIVSIDYWSIEMWLNVDGNFPEKRVLLEGLTSGNELAICDIDGDNDQDIVFTETGDPGLTTGWLNLLTNDGTGHFTRRYIDPDYRGVQAVRTVDLDKDGDMDIVTCALFQLGIVWCDTAWYENDGSENFTRHLIDSYLMGASDIDVGDMDHDEDLDILWGDVDGFRFGWFENDGDQNFTFVEIDVEYDSITSSVFWDMNFDDYPDMLLTTRNPEELVLVINLSNNNYQLISISTTGMEYPKRPQAADLDNDGDMDIVNAYYSEEHDFVWWENDGDMNFTLRIIEPFYDQVLRNFPADLNDDGRIDIVAGFGLGALAWWENQPHIGVDLEMPAHHFTPGSNCGLTATVFNHHPDYTGELPLFIMLEAAENYWFYPNWTSDLQYQTVTITPGENELTIIDPFTWPTGCGSATGIYFYSLFTKPDFSMLMGTIDYWDFSWIE